MHNFAVFLWTLLFLVASLIGFSVAFSVLATPGPGGALEVLVGSGSGVVLAGFAFYVLSWME